MKTKYAVFLIKPTGELSFVNGYYKTHDDAMEFLKSIYFSYGKGHYIVHECYELDRKVVTFVK